VVLVIIENCLGHSLPNDAMRLAILIAIRKYISASGSPLEFIPFLSTQQRSIHSAIVSIHSRPSYIGKGSLLSLETLLLEIPLRSDLLILKTQQRPRYRQPIFPPEITNLIIMSTLIDITTEEEWQKHTESLPPTTLQIINFHVCSCHQSDLPIHLLMRQPKRHHGQRPALKCNLAHPDPIHPTHDTNPPAGPPSSKPSPPPTPSPIPSAHPGYP
jgi:hypothetical protein